MGAVISFITRVIMRRINQEVRAYMERLEEAEAAFAPDNNQNPPANEQNEESVGRETENWALLHTEYIEEGTERQLYFSIQNGRNERIVHGIVYQDVSNTEMCNVLAYWIDQRNGNTHGASLQYPIDFDGLLHYGETYEPFSAHTD